VGAPGRDSRSGGGLRSFLRSFRFAAQGIVYVVRTQRNARVHLLITGLVVVGGLYFRVSTTEWAVLMATVGLVLSAEVFNTVVELAVDLLVQYQDPRAKVAKDAGAGAVLIAAICSVGVGVAVFGPRLWALVFGTRPFRP
jgi:diacylglycerol kinase (ATP)